jgi:hypothetical protein
VGANDQAWEFALRGQSKNRRNIFFHEPSVAWLSARDNRAVFKLTKKLCEHGITPDEVKELLTQGQIPVIENFVSKRANKFAAHLVLSAKKDKAEFEFLPR